MKYLIIDGNSILNRSFYGIRELKSSDGTPTNAVYGFFNILYKHISEEKPDRIAVAFDLKEKTYRHIMYDGYKANRSETPEALLEQFPITKNILRAMNIPTIEKPGLEADDIIGIISKYCDDTKNPCVILTGDKDSFQLISDNTTVKLATNKNDIVFTPKSLYEKYGLTPEQMTDLKALMGDSSDNIPGIKGIGEKTALTLIKKYSTLDNLYAHADEIKGSIGEKIRDGKDSAYMSKKLGTIVRNGDIGIITDKIPEPKIDSEKLFEIFSKLELKSLIQKYLPEVSDSEKKNKSVEKNKSKVGS